MDLQPLNKPNKTLSYLLALLSVVIWSSAFPGTRYALDYYGPMSLMLMRFIPASITLIIIGIIKKIRLPRKQDILKFLAGGFAGVFLYMLFFNLGAVSVVSGVAGFIVASSPVYTLILSRIFLKETVKPLGWAGVLVSFGGLIIIMVSQVTEFALGAGIFLIFVSAISTGVHSIIQRNFLKHYTALEATTYTMIGATVFMLIFIPEMIREIPGNTLPVNLVVLYLGIVPAALGYLCWGFALSKAENTVKIAVFLYLIPFFASLLAFVWLGETFSLLTFMGGVVIIAGMLLTNFARS
ncbi:MAG: DMT family transporter [Oscillospiraceae bacterium]|nr:DMT family transporter [Oscillospiraceae bacterium]